MTILREILHALGLEHEQPEPVDVTSHLDNLTAQADQPLDWRHSVVDLMKLLGLDSSPERRHALAEELRYRGDLDTPHMNAWLHQQIMHKLADNGGRVPMELL